jgi:lipopolysaccharide export system permease protein
MKTLIQRYLAASFIMPFILSTVFFVSFLLTFQLFRLTDLIVSKGLTLGYTVKLFGHIAMTFLPMAIPLSVLFATIYTMNKLCGDSEYVSLRSFGFKKHQIFTPFLCVSLVISIVTYVLNQNNIPHAKTQFKQIISNMKSASFLSELKSGQFFTSIPNITLFAEEVTDGGRKLSNVYIHTKARKTGKEKSIFAKSGEMLQFLDRDSKKESLRLVLKQGNIFNIKSKINSEKIIFDTYNFPIGAKSLLGTISTKASMMSGSRLLKYIETPKNQWKKKRMTNSDIIRAKLEYWTRFNTPLQCLAFTLIGFVLGIKDNRSHGGNKSGLNLIVLVGYYVVFFGLISMARKGTIPAQVAVFLPTLLLTFLGAKFYKSLDWNS